MKKSNYITVCFLILLLIGFVLFFQFYKNANRETDKKIEQLYRITEENHEDLENLIILFESEVNRNITDSSMGLSKETTSAFERLERSFSYYFRTMEILTSDLHEKLQENLLENSSRLGADFSLILKYLTDASSNKIAVALSSVSRSVEMDYKKEQMLEEGFLRYTEEDYTAAVKIYEKVLYLDPDNAEALCYSNASLFYRNPGDGSNYYKIKRDIVPLLDLNDLPVDVEKTVLDLLIGISREEGSSDQTGKYQAMLNMLTGGAQ
ncbi:MAG: hypothetical protein L3J12_08820 [Spirochaetales bacterium]|nr:hypothetical protein [Spirochaetales bacterium]